MHIPAFLLIILIGGILFDLDAWGIALAIIIAGVIGGFITMGGPAGSECAASMLIKMNGKRSGCRRHD
jgi:hypothetical protein